MKKASNKKTLLNIAENLNMEIASALEDLTGAVGCHGGDETRLKHLHEALKTLSHMNFGINFLKDELKKLK